MKLKRVLTLICSLWIGSVFASSTEQEMGIVISDAQFRAPIPGMANSVGYMTIHNSSDAKVTLVSARSNVAKAVEFHDHIMKDGVMKMVKVEHVTIDAKQTQTFESGGLHLMFLGLNQVIQSEQDVEVFVTTKDGREFKVLLPVKSVKEHHHHH